MVIIDRSVDDRVFDVHELVPCRRSRIIGQPAVGICRKKIKIKLAHKFNRNVYECGMADKLPEAFDWKSFPSEDSPKTP